jgi:tRNA dimethylallyltransferase
LFEHFAGKVSLDQAIENIKVNTRRLAKKQRTWQRRFRGVRWFDLGPDDSMEDLADRVMDQVRMQ